MSTRENIRLIARSSLHFREHFQLVMSKFTLSWTYLSFYLWCLNLHFCELISCGFWCPNLHVRELIYFGLWCPNLHFRELISCLWCPNLHCREFFSFDLWCLNLHIPELFSFDLWCLNLHIPELISFDLWCLNLHIPELNSFGFTPASNLGYLAPPGQFFMGAKLFIGTPWMGNEGVLKKFGLGYVTCMVSMATHSEFEKGVCLQNYSHLSCYLS